MEGVEYEILFKKPNSHHYGDADGTCQPPDQKNPKININPYLTKQSELNTAIHEVAHAYFWDAPEHTIKAFGNTLSRFLYNYCKWRKLQRRNYKKGSAHKSDLLENVKENKHGAKAKKPNRRVRKKN